MLSTETQTTQESAPIADSVSSEITTEAVSTEVEESPASSGSETASIETIQTQEETTGGSTTLTADSFDVGSWDGEIDSLPEDVREFVRLVSDRKEKNLEAGYTPKFQQLAEDRKTFEETRETWTGAKEELEAELKLYKALVDGNEDPRVQDLQTELEKALGAVKEGQDQQKALQQKYDVFQEKQDQLWLKQFKEQYKHIVEDDEKYKQLIGLADLGWEEEAAAQLVDLPEEVRQAAAEIVQTHGLAADGHKFAIQHAKMKLGHTTSPRKPRAASLVTAGATGQTNTARVQGGNIREMSRTDARQEAAKMALKGGNTKKGRSRR